MDDMRILRLWAAAAWADGVLDPMEKAALERWIEASDQFTPDLRKEAAALLAARPTIDLEEARRLPAAQREGVYRAALGIMHLDGELAADEQSFLTRLKGVLDLDPATIAKIEQE